MNTFLDFYIKAAWGIHTDYWLGMKNIDHFLCSRLLFKTKVKTKHGKAALFAPHISSKPALLLQHPVPSVFCCLALQTFKGCF